MHPVSSAICAAAQLPVSAAGVKEPQNVPQPGDAARGRSPRPVTDVYVPEEPQEPSGRYWLGRDADGRPKVCFDDPAQAAGAPQRQDGPPAADVPDADRDAGGPDRKASRDRAENCTCNTDRVDREIEKLKKRLEELKRQIRSETDDTRIRELERKLSQTESELSRKDNDAYRRQHAVFS